MIYISKMCISYEEIEKIIRKCNYIIIIDKTNDYKIKELYKKYSKDCPFIILTNIVDFYKWLKKTKITEKTKIGIITEKSITEKEMISYKNLIEFYLFYNRQKKMFEKKIKQYNKNFLNKKDNDIIIDALNKFISINSGGKYLRALLISLGYFITSKEEKNDYIPLALAYETFQTSILIHDDIIDNAKIRRGKDTIPTMYQKEFSCKDKNVANSLGLCIGDIGLYLANKIIYDNYAKEPYFDRLIKYYNDIVIKTLKGEILDVKLPHIVKKESQICNEDNIFEIYKLKTSYYTIVGPFCLGLILGGASKRKIKLFENTLENIGIAFQIKDDIIGIFGNEKDIGKTNSDIKEFKQTILYSFVYKHKEYLNELNKYYGKDNLSQKEIKIVKQIFIESGALEYANKTMNDLFINSLEKINNLKIKKNYKNILLGFVNYLMIRQK